VAGPGLERGGHKARAVQTEVALKEAGRRVFARSGYLDAKITDIAAEAGRSVGSFYKHFAGKDELLQALLADWVAQAGAELASQSDDLSEPAALRFRVAAYWFTYRAHVPEIRALLQAAQVSRPSPGSWPSSGTPNLARCVRTWCGSGRPDSSCRVTRLCWPRRSTPCSKGSVRSGSPGTGSRSAGCWLKTRPSTH